MTSSVGLCQEVHLFSDAQRLSGILAHYLAQDAARKPPLGNFSNNFHSTLEIVTPPDNLILRERKPQKETPS